MDTLVSTEWLAAHMGASDIRILDATYHPNFPGEPPRDAAAEYAAAHIPAHSSSTLPRCGTRPATCP